MSSRYRCVDTQKAAGFPVAAACDAAGVSTSAFYAWRRQREASPRSERSDAQLVDEIRGIHATLGRHLRRSAGDPVTAPPRAHGQPQARRTADARPRHRRARPRRRRCLTKADKAVPPAPDLVGRLFDPARIDVTWCGDITYVPTDEGWLYLASVLDLASRRLVGWSISDSHHAGLVVHALDAAVAARARQHGRHHLPLRPWQRRLGSRGGSNTSLLE